MPRTEYSVSFGVNNVGAYQNHKNALLPELDAELLAKFKRVLAKQYPRGVLSEDLKTFVTDEPVELIDSARARWKKIVVRPLLTTPALRRKLGEYVDSGTETFNAGEILLFPARREPMGVSKTAVGVVAQDKNLPEDVEALIKTYGGKTRRSRRRRTTRRR